MQDAMARGMRAAIIVLAAFALIFIAVSAWGLRSPAPDRSTTPARPALPASFSSAWSVTPAFLKSSRAELRIDGLPLPATEEVTLAPGRVYALSVRGAGAWYQTKRMVRVVLGNPQFASLALAYPPIAPPSNASSEDALNASNPAETIVLPQTGGIVRLSCSGPYPCAVSL